MSKTPAQRAAKHGEKVAVHAQPARAAAGQGTGRGSAGAGKPAGNGNLIAIPASVASLFLFWYFHLLTLTQMTQLSNGLAMPDSLPGGFSEQYIGQLRAAMNADALGQLQYVHKTAGTLFPLVSGLSVVLLVSLNVASKRLRRILWVAPLLFIVASLWSNFAVDGMLAAPRLEGGQVALASGLVVAAWALLVISVLAAVFALLLNWRLRSRRRRMRQRKADGAGEPA